MPVIESGNPNLKKLFAGFTSLIAALPFVAIGDDESGDFVRLVAELDEPEFYCFDLAGWGEHLKLDDPLQIHTCKTRGGEDQMFHFTDDQLIVSKYDRCAQVAGSGGETLVGSAVLARACSDDPLQKISLDDNGRIHVGDTGLCLGAGPDSTEASGPSHMWRTLTVVGCEGGDKNLLTWQKGLESL